MFIFEIRFRLVLSQATGGTLRAPSPKFPRTKEANGDDDVVAFVLVVGTHPKRLRVGE